MGSNLQKSEFSKFDFFKNRIFIKVSLDIAKNVQQKLTIILRKKIRVLGQISNLGSFGVEFRTSPIVDKLYLKMKLLTRALQKS